MTTQLSIHAEGNSWRSQFMQQRRNSSFRSADAGTADNKNVAANDATYAIPRRRRGTRKRLVATESRREGVYNRAAAASVIACGEEPRRSGRAATFPTNRMFTQDNKNVAANDATYAATWRARHDTAPLLI